MVSFDVTSLFTSIPQNLTIEAIELLLQSKYDATENRLGHAQILQLLKFCLRTYFTFDGTIYEQVKGTPMGSPISGIHRRGGPAESLVFQNHRPKFWARCVDDTFVVIEKVQVLTFKDKIAELQYLRRILKANDYPRNFVNRCIHKGDERPNRTDTKSWRALPYVKNVSEAVGRLLALLEVGVAHRPEATIRRLVMKPKCPVPRLETSGVVYRIWRSCGQSNYVGETG
ncbi:hypothetical protein SprV_0200570100 [Sparganum proliferum]